RHNIGMSVDESLEAFRPVAERAAREGVWLRGYVSTAFVCPYEGAMSASRVADVTARLFDLGAAEVSIGDTIGAAVPSDVARLLDVLAPKFSAARLALHFHDTRGTALANVMAALPYGIVRFDSSAGGLGGCPYAPGAGGNLATEDLLYLLDGLGVATGVSLAKVLAASRGIEEKLGHALASRYAAAERARR